MKTLSHYLSSYSKKISTTKQPSTLQEVCNLAMDMTSAYVGEELLQKQVLFLPAVHDFFAEQQNTILKASTGICT